MAFTQAPTSVVLTDANGFEINLGGGSGPFTRAPLSVVVTDKTGATMTVLGAGSITAAVASSPAGPTFIAGTVGFGDDATVFGPGAPTLWQGAFRRLTFNGNDMFFGGELKFSSTINSNAASTLSLNKQASGVLGIGNGGAADASAGILLGTVTIQDANGANWIKGRSSELLTLSTSGVTTDTVGNLLPANAIIEAVVARVTTTITVATNWKLGDATIAGRFTAADSVMTANETQVGLVHIDQVGTSGPRQTAAAKVRVTTTGTPGAGAIRITVFYRQFIAPTS